MAIDTTPGNVAIGQLQSIPFDNLIGAPLIAAVKAQNLAAKTCVEFIESVGFNVDANGNKEAINVVFIYQRGTQMVNLIVPLLTIVPIPYIRIDDMNINFKANISAGSDESTSNSSTQEYGANVKASYSAWYSPVSVEFNASYSSKKDSTSTKNSRYAVEYTMDVNVHAIQDDIPKGMSTVLQILNDSINSAPEDGALNLTGPSGIVSLDPSQGSTDVQVDFQLINGLFKAVKDVDLSSSFTVEPSTGSVSGALTAINGTTDQNGAADFTLKITHPSDNGATPLDTDEITIKFADVPTGDGKTITGQFSIPIEYMQQS